MQATQEVVSRLPLCTAAEFDAAVGAAKAAFPGWRDTPVPVRARVMFKLQELIRRDMVSSLPFKLNVHHKAWVQAQDALHRRVSGREAATLCFLISVLGGKNLGSLNKFRG